MQQEPGGHTRRQEADASRRDRHPNGIVRPSPVGQALGLAHRDRDVVEFLRRAGLDDAAGCWPWRVRPFRSSSPSRVDSVFEVGHVRRLPLVDVRDGAGAPPALVDQALAVVGVAGALGAGLRCPRRRRYGRGPGRSAGQFALDVVEGAAFPALARRAAVPAGVGSGSRASARRPRRPGPGLGVCAAVLACPRLW